MDLQIIKNTQSAELRLYKLSKSDKQAFLQEEIELLELIKKCEILLTHPSKFDQWIIELLKEIKKKLGKPRKEIWNCCEQIKIRNLTKRI